MLPNTIPTIATYWTTVPSLYHLMDETLFSRLQYTSTATKTLTATKSSTTTATETSINYLWGSFIGMNVSFSSKAAFHPVCTVGLISTGA